MNIKTKFDIKQNVLLKHDGEKRPRMVTGISIRSKDVVSYHLLSGTVDSWHYEYEIEELNTNQIKTGFIK